MSQITYLSSVVPLDSPLYVRRESVDDFCEQQLREVKPGAESLPLIRVKGAKSMGKSSLLVRLRDFAEEELQHVVALVDLNSVSSVPNVFEDLDIFLHQFTSLIVRGITDSRNLPTEIKEQLEQKLEELESVWRSQLGVIFKYTNYLDNIFNIINKPKTLLLDGIDAVAKQSVETSLQSLLRHWHETKMKRVERDTRIVWPSIVIAYSTLNYGFGSPVHNIGRLVTLSEFTQNEVSNLAREYRLDWNPNDSNLISLMNLVGGHPMLANWALYRVSQDHISLDELKRQVIEEYDNSNAPITELLLDSLRVIQGNKDLLDSLKSILRGKGCNSESVSQLERAGLIKLKGSEWHISCELYSEYFRRHLQLD